MKKFLFSLLTVIALMTPFAASKADAQVVVRVGPHRHYHRHYYHHHYYHHR